MNSDEVSLVADRGIETPRGNIEVTTKRRLYDECQRDVKLRREPGRSKQAGRDGLSIEREEGAAGSPHRSMTEETHDMCWS